MAGLPWYRAGTVTVTSGSKNVSGVDTLWQGVIAAGDAFFGPDQRWYEIASVTAHGALALATPYLGGSAAVQAYAVMRVLPSGNLAADLAADLTALRQRYLVTLDEVADLYTKPGDVAFTDVAGVRQTVPGWGKLQQRVTDKIGELEGWKNGVVEVINGVEVLKAAGVYQFQRKAPIYPGPYPQCTTTPNGPTYIQLLEFSTGAAGGSFFEVNVHKAHRGMGDSDYYEYLELRGTYWADGIGGIARKFSNGANRMSLFRSDAANIDQTIPLLGDGTPVPFTVKEINSGDGSKKYALMLVVFPLCGAGEEVGIVARYSDPHAKPAANFTSAVKPAYPNL